jgi:hypothetical protein
VAQAGNVMDSIMGRTSLTESEGRGAANASFGKGVDRSAENAQL